MPDRNDTSAQADGVVAAFLEHGRPFGLYLRNFTFEAYDVERPANEVDPRTLVTYMGGLSPVEDHLADGLGDDVVILAVANPSDDIVYRARFPRLRLPRGDWLEGVEWLVHAASFIVLDVEVLAPGVVEEIALIEGARRTDDTLVVLRRGEQPEPFEVALIKATGGQFPDHPRVDADSPAIAAFTSTVYADDDLIATPGLTTLLDRYHRQANGEVDDESQHRRADLTGGWAVQREAHGDLAGAIRAYRWTADQFLDLGDQAIAARTFMRMGACHLELGDPAAGLDAFRAAGEHSSESYFADVFLWMARAHHLAGDLDQAAQHALAALDRALPSHINDELRGDALELLARVYRDGGDRRSARKFERELKGHRRRAEEYERELERARRLLFG